MRKQGKKNAAKGAKPVKSEGNLKKALLKGIAAPEDVLAAAEQAPRVFAISAYYRPIRLMREKGHSWRAMAKWLQQFEIEVSYVHLRRLFIQENKRLSKLNEEQLKELGMPPEMIKDILEENDPVERLPAADPEDEDAENTEEML